MTNLKNNFQFDFYLKKVSNPLGQILFLHGFWSSYKIAINFANTLTDYDFWAFNFPGHEKTPPLNRPINFDQLIYATKKFIDENNLKNIILIAHSLGGGVATILANRFPHLFKKIIYISPMNPFEFSEEIELSKYFFAKNYDDYQTLITKIYAKGKEMLANNFFASGLKRKFELEGRNDPVKKELFLSLFNEEIKLLLLNAYAKNVVESLIVLGAHDKISCAKKVSSLYYRAFKNSKVVIVPTTGHVTIYEDLEVFLKIFKEFIYEQKINS